ncbi:MAG: zf-HC2 domain-containing protein [Actinobacteria bacterium]|nr:zf-HC2 domain-containing protein [Actinomycetota bacterium]MCA1720116.1 zf-HC2 domain-containing protein [Actinomycetota bacterium]
MTRSGSRICGEVQANLPAYVDRSLPRVRRRLVGLHLRRCSACGAAFARQRDVHSGLASLSQPAERPPDGLLEQLLDSAARPGVKGRVAVPARGAVSGARPALSVALLVAGAAAGTGLGYAGWRGARAARSRLRR